MAKTERANSYWSIVLACAAMMAVTTGIRLSLGLFVRPIAAAGIGVAWISLVLAVGQFFWGAAQPLFGLLSERIGTRLVLMQGSILLALGLALAPLLRSPMGLLLTLGLLSAAGAGAGSFAILIGAAAQRLEASRRAFVTGLINAGGSFGQLLIAPLTQLVISGWGWSIAMWGLAAAGFATIFLARAAAGPGRAIAVAGAVADHHSPATALRAAFKDRSYLYLHAGFFTCGFHIAFLVTHLPSEIALCGLPVAAGGIALGLIGLFNIAGSIGAGWLGGRFRMKSFACAAVRNAGSADTRLPRGAEDPAHAVPFFRRARHDLARDRAANRGTGGQAVWHAAPIDAVWPDPAIAPDWRLLRRVARRCGAIDDWKPPVGLVCGRRTRGVRGADQPADPRSAAPAAHRAGYPRVGAPLWRGCAHRKVARREVP